MVLAIEEVTALAEFDCLVEFTRNGDPTRDSTGMIMNQLTLTDSEVKMIGRQLADIMSRYTSVEDPDFLNSSAVIAHEIPTRVRKFLNDFKQLEPPSGICLISGYPVFDAGIGRTPTHWKHRPEPSPMLEMELLFVLMASLLGDVIGWATQQDGYLIHDVLPIKEDEYSQIGTGSQQLIWWHNEDAFHPYRGDYVGLMCLRNPDRVATTFASVDMIRLEHCSVRTLFEPRFTIRPDESHDLSNDLSNDLGNGNGHSVNGNGHTVNNANGRSVNNGNGHSVENGNGHSVQSPEHNGAMREPFGRPRKIAIMSGDPSSPYLRLDPYFMDPPDDDEAQQALTGLIGEIDSKLSEVVLNPGDILFVDNYKTVHGRRPFKARYDGSDRWLKRVNITRDLRRSRDSRGSCTSRVII